jgi:hypothetical protein
MIEEFGDFYSSCEYNKAFYWVMKLNILREAPLMERFGAGLGRMVSREAVIWKKRTVISRKLIVSNRDGFCPIADLI